MGTNVRQDTRKSIVFWLLTATETTRLLIITNQQPVCFVLMRQFQNEWGYSHSMVPGGLDVMS
jgi:hypothetical protein